MIESGCEIDPGTRQPPGGSPLHELAFLHEIAQLATLARDWDELMRTIVDRTTAAMGVEVCSFYLADRDRTRLTLAATNGLDRTQVGRVSLAFGEGITGRVAAGREPIAVAGRDDATRASRGSAASTSRACTRCCRCRSSGTRTSSGCSTSRPPRVREFRPDEIAFLQTIAALLAGIVEKGRLTAEVEARLAQLTALDAARAELLSVVTHELRTPLVGRAGLRRPAGRGGARRARTAAPANGATPRLTSSRGWIGRSIRSSPRFAARA